MLRPPWFRATREGGKRLAAAAAAAAAAGALLAADAGSTPSAALSFGHARRALSAAAHEVHAVALASPPSLYPARRARGARTAARENRPPTPTAPSVTRHGLPRPATSIASPADLTLFRLTDLGAGHGSLVNEPSVASNGVGVLETWDWYAARSANGGATFTYLDPYTQFPATWGGFCCRQVAQYDPSRDLYIWVLQYVPDGSANNGLRLVVAKGQAGLLAGNFTYWDLTPQAVGSPSGQNYDFPKIALTSNGLFLTASIYAGNPGTWQRSAVLRFSLDTLAARQGLSYSYYFPGQELNPVSYYFSPGLTQGATTTMYFGVHVTNAQLRVYGWPDGSNQVTAFDVNHTAYPTEAPWQCLRTGAPSAANWCQRADDRLPNGWVSQGKIGFAWTASQGQATGGFGNFPYPYIHVVRINELTHALVDEPYIWSSNFAFAYPSIAPDPRGDLGGTYLWGGGPYYENCGGLIRDSYSGNIWQTFGVTASNADPSAPQGGDFLSTRENGGNANTWSAACYALVGGGAPSNVHSYYLSFGRAQDSPFPGAPTGVRAAHSTVLNSATVSWNPPASDGGHLIAGYVVTPFVGAAAQRPTAVGHVTSATISGLTNGTTYTFRVAAVNAFGTGAQSSASNALTPAQCLGKSANIVGTDGPDVLVGGAGNDVIAGLGGNDRIEGGGGDDIVCGGAGDDTILGQDGADELFGEDGNDTVDGGAGYLDVVSGGPGNDVLRGNEFASVSYITSSAGVTVDLAHQTASGEGRDTLSGFANVFGSEHSDTLIGNKLGNFLAGLGGNDVIQGGEGVDVVAFIRSAQADLATGRSSGPQEGTDALAGIEGLAGGGTGQTYDFVGDAHDNILFTSGGNATLRGGGGSDTIAGLGGNDHLYGDAGNDLLEAGTGVSTVDGGSGANDEVSYAQSLTGVNVDLARGSATAPGIQDTLRGVESVSGSPFDDTLAGNDRANSLFGQAGNDTLLGRKGNDFLNGGSGRDSADAGPGKDYCLDTELARRCEVIAKTPAAAGSTGMIEPLLSRVLAASCGREACPNVTGDLSLLPDAAAGIPLNSLADSHAEPTCDPGRRGGVTSIAPPKSINGRWLGNNGAVRWQAWLYRNGSRRPIVTTPIATGKLQGPGQIPGTPNAWYDANERPVRQITKRLGPGFYHWEETVTLQKFGPAAKGKLLYYYQPPGHASAVKSCDFRARR